MRQRNEHDLPAYKGSMSESIAFNKLICEINKQLGSGVAAERILDFIFESLNLVIPYDRMSIAQLGEGGRLTLFWARSKIAIENLAKGFSFNISGTSLEKLLDNNQPRIIDDLLRYEAEHPLSETTKLAVKDGIRANLTFPLKADNKAIGFVFLSSSAPYVYNQSHIDTFLSIAEELAVIVEHARLRELFDERKRNEMSFNQILHDLKSPLGVIQGYLSFASSEDWFQGLGSDAKDIFTVLKRNAKYMNELLDELSELRCLKQSLSTIKLEPVMLNDFCADILANGRLLGRYKETEFNLHAAHSLPPKVWLDRHKIWRVLDNLISNAVKFSQRRTQVEAQIKVEGHRLIFSVRDEGPGIPEAEIPLLFREGGQTSVRPTEGENSTGLGLAIARTIIDAHGGGISVHSQVGRGSEFTFWIPLLENLLVREVQS